MGTLRIGVSSKSLINVLQTLQTEYDNEEFNEFMLAVEDQVFGYTIRDKPKNLVLNIPVSPMLGRSAKSFKDLEKFVLKNKKVSNKSVLSEYKYDGERAQLHFNGRAVNLFSRGFKIQNYKFLELHS